MKDIYDREKGRENALLKQCLLVGQKEDGTDYIWRSWT